MESKYKAVTRVSPGKLEIEEKEPIALLAGHVRVRVESAPLNPSDKFWVLGVYGDQSRLTPGPKGIGFEGAGQIIEIGEGVDASFLNKKVGILADPHAPTYTGTVAQQIVIPAVTAFPFPDHVEYNDICSTGVNPLTACGFVYLAKKNGYSAIIQSASASALGKQVIRLAKQEGVKVINIVRREEQAQEIKAIGAEYVLDSSTESFWTDLDALFKELNPTAYFDCLAGDLSSKIFAKMPHNSTLYNYGALSGQPLTISALTLIFETKTLTSFWLGVWLATLTPEEMKEQFGKVILDLSTGGKIFGTKVAKEYPLAQINEALAETDKLASVGKVIIKPQL